MTMEVGETVWIPCEVTRGVFPDERNVVIESPGGRWYGFVDVACLRDDILEGKTAIRATVVEARKDKVRARLPGQADPRHFVTVSAT